MDVWNEMGGGSDMVANASQGLIRGNVGLHGNRVCGE
jgi:hypothetical protein